MDVKELTDSDVLRWLARNMRGSVKVFSDGSREPQIAWTFQLGDVFYGPNPLEAIQNAYQASVDEDSQKSQ